MDNEILYEVDATEFKNRDRLRRVLIQIIDFSFEMSFLALFYFHFGIWSIIAYILVLGALFPAPFFHTPDKYKITNQGVDCNGKKFFLIKKNYKFKINDKRMFVSILRRRMVEFLRLYTQEPKKVNELLQNLISSPNKISDS